MLDSEDATYYMELEILEALQRLWPLKWGLIRSYKPRLREVLAVKLWIVDELGLSTWDDRAVEQSLLRVWFASPEEAAMEFKLNVGW